jgi:hypothetical protein
MLTSGKSLLRAGAGCTPRHNSGPRRKSLSERDIRPKGRTAWSPRSDSGQAMIIVLAMVTVLMTLPAVLLATNVGQFGLTNQNLYWNGAYVAAEAGLNDYIQHLDANESFAGWSRGTSPCTANPDPFSGTSSHTDDPFCGWVQLSTSPPEWYEYALPSTYGSIGLTVSGKSGVGSAAVVRTFSYKIVPGSSFLDDIYWTNYEYTDYDIQNGQCKLAGGDYYYPAGTNPDNNCRIVFQTTDVVDGPAFSNDTFCIEGPAHFEGPVYSAGWTRGEPATGSASPCTAGNGDFIPGSPANAKAEPLPGTAADAAAAQQVGCYISGANGKPANVSLTLSAYPSASPTTTAIKWTSPNGTVQDSASNTNACGTSGSTVYANAMQSALFYVNGDVTIAANSTEAGFLTIVAGDDSGVGIVDGSETDSSTAGDITLQGNITYPASDIESATTCGALTQCDPYDALGLIGAYFVRLAPGLSNVTIDAALLALSGSFYVEGWGQNGSEGTLEVFGSIAQDFRGPVGLVGGTGYSKDYVYDSALETLWPPYYLSSTSATWGPTSYAEDTPGCANRAVTSASC